jgi:non-ribosomal peptide synthetase component F
MVLMAAYVILLSKYTRQEDIIVGSPTAGRRHSDLDNIIGLFVNMLPMRNQPNREKTFREFLAEVKVNALNAYENQDFQFEDLVWNLKLKIDPGRNPLFDAVFVLQNTGVGEIPVIDNKEPDQLKSFLGGVELKKTHHEILLNVEEINDKLSMILQYSSELYKESSARKMSRHYIEILEQIVEDRDIKLRDINISHELIAATFEKNREESGDFRF